MSSPSGVTKRVVGLRTGLSSAVVSLALGAACSAGSGPSGSSVSGGSGASTGSGHSGGTIGVSGGSGGSGASVTVGSGGAAGQSGCQEGGLKWDPKVPTVYLLVDRSGSMFLSSGGATPWQALRSGALGVISQLQDQVRFGFAAYAAYQEATSGAACPQSGRFVDLPTQTADLNNSESIATVYNALDKPNSGKIDTGSSYALDAMAQALWSDPSDGEKYILFVTDGEPDYCDDPSPQCPIDSVVWTLQRLRAGLDRSGGAHSPISTIVLGVATSLTKLGEQALVQFANAGAGQPVAPLLDPDNGTPYTGERTFYECQSVTGWAADLAATAKGNLNSVGTYVTPGGTLQPFKPSATDQDAIAQQISAALAGVKACTFDLGGEIQVDLNQLSLAHVYIEGTAVPLDPENGWRMNNSTQIELVGSACATWRDPANQDIAWDFPCEIIIPK
ncbi:MAG TPA: vWA domain-containing protein [Polyangiaceae bacterium]|nr:vWA domain-containing protein [Polyangiaceae bacterium]